MEHNNEQDAQGTTPLPQQSRTDAPQSATGQAPLPQPSRSEHAESAPAPAAPADDSDDNVKAEIKALFQELEHKFTDLKMMSVTSADGLPIYTKVYTEYNVDKEKISALSSSLSALSKVAAKRLIGAPLVRTNIETDGGNMFLISTAYESKPCVLCLVTGPKQNLGHARYFANQLAVQLKENNRSDEEE